MNSTALLLLESTTLICLSGFLVLSIALRHAPVGFQHYNLFFYGTPPDRIIPVESTDGAAATFHAWR